MNRTFKSIISLLLISLLLVNGVFAQLPDGGPEEAGTNFHVMDTGNFKSVMDTGLLPDISVVKNGMYSGHWANYNVTPTFTNVPKDLNKYMTLEMDIYAPKKDNSQFIILINCPDSAAGICYFRKDMIVNWEGWKHFSFQVGNSSEEFSKVREASWENVVNMRFQGSGWSLPIVDGAHVYVGDIYFTPQVGEATAKTFSTETIQEFSKISGNVAAVYAGTSNVLAGGLKNKMSAKTEIIDGVLCAPEEYFSKYLKITPKTSPVGDNNLYPVEKTLKATEFDCYINGSFAAAGMDVSEIESDNDLYRYVAYQTCYNTVDEIEYTMDDINKMIDTWQASLAGTQEDWERTDDPLFAQRVKSVESTAMKYADTMDDETLWEGNWAHDAVKAQAVYNNTYRMALGYFTKGTSTYKSPELKQKILTALDVAYETLYGEDIVKNAKFTQYSRWKDYNWWYWQIGIPMPLIDTLLLMYDDIPEEDRLRYLSPVDVMVEQVFSVGANRIWIAYSVLGCGIMENNPAKILNARDALAVECAYKSEKNMASNGLNLGDGIYDDGSFLQHDGVAYNFGYGMEFVSNILVIYPVFKNTAFEILDPDAENLYDWLLNNYNLAIYKGQAMAMFSGRNMTRGSNEYDGGVSHLNNLLTYAKFAEESEADVLKGIIKYQAQNAWKNKDNTFYPTKIDFSNLSLYCDILKDETIEPKIPEANAKVFYNVERTVSLNDKYAFGLSLSSKRIKRWEAINNENMKGWYEGDGVTYFYIDGLNDFSKGYWDYANMYKLPGITNDTSERFEENMQGTNSEIPRGHNDYSGGASLEGKYTASAMQLIGYTNDPANGFKEHKSTLEAKKAYFTFDDEVVMLGSDINAKDDREVFTVVDNRQMTGMVNISEDAAYTKLPIAGITASEHDGNVPENISDGSLSSRWSALGEQWLMIDMGEPVNVGGVTMAFYSGDKRKTKFDIEVSADGINFEEVFAGESSGKTVEAEPYEIMKDNVRYIRFNCHGNNQSQWNSIAEIEVHKPNNDGVFKVENKGVKFGTENVYVENQLMTEVEYAKTTVNTTFANYADKAGYYFPGGAKTTMIKDNSPTPYMILQVEHGKNPSKGKYSYAYLPNYTNEQTKEYANNPDITVIANNETVQAVTDKTIGVTGYVFWKKGKADAVEADNTCIVVTRETEDEFVLSVAEPTRLARNINLVIQRGGLEISESALEITAECKADSTNINLKLPEYDNGRSYEIKFKKLTKGEE